MRITQPIRKGAVVVSAIAGLLLPSTGTAHADDLGVGAADGVKCAGGVTTVNTNCVAATITTRVYPDGLGKDVVEFECTVTATALAASTSIDSCSVGSARGLLVPYTLPGSMVTSAGAAIITSGSSVSVCVTGHAEFIKGNNPGEVGGCSNAILIRVL